MTASTATTADLEKLLRRKRRESHHITSLLSYVTEQWQESNEEEDRPLLMQKLHELQEDALAVEQEIATILSARPDLRKRYRA